MLKPDTSGDTFEQGLFFASQRELEEEQEQYREVRLNSNIGWFYRLRFFVSDYVWEPLVTVGRFLELSVIFLPLLVTIPVSWFGKRGCSIWYKIVRISLDHAGASFVKLGQWAASRTDIFPQEFCNELGKLHSSASPHSLHYTKKVLTQSFGLPFDEIFHEFCETPVGVGAIAQVYTATLSSKTLENMEFHPLKTHKRTWFNTLVNETPSPNQRVAIKVMHPRVATEIKRDLRIMNFFARAIDMIPTMEWLSLPDEVHNFGVLMNLQLDLRIEALNLQKFQENYNNDFFINFPTPYLNFCNRTILVEEYINGVSMSKILELKQKKKLNQDLSHRLSDKVIDSFLHMLIMHNFIHSDLHPGNIIIRFVKPNDLNTEIVSTAVQRDAISDKLKSQCDLDFLSEQIDKLSNMGFHPEVCYIDAGLVTELNQTNRINFIALFNSLAEFDGYKAGELMIERSKTPDTAIDPEIFALKTERLVDKIKQRTFTLGTVSIGDLLERMLTMVRAHHVRMEGDFVSVVVAILLLEGLGRQLDPEMDLFARWVWFFLMNGIPEN
jgi:aarF domain-containing kinase